MSPEEQKIALLEEENKSLKEKLVAFKDLDEELAAKRIYAIALKRLQALVTFGGIVTIISGLIGYKIIFGYIKDRAEAVANRMDSVAVTRLAIDNINNQVIPLGRREMNLRIAKFYDTLSQVQSQVLNLIVSTSQPLDVTRTRTSTGALDDANKPSPFSLDLSAAMGPARDGGQEGSVVGFALESAMEYSILKQKKEKVLISPRYIYNGAKKGNGDNGALIIDGLRLLKEKGAVLESEWPYKAGGFSEAPPPNINSAVHYRISGYLKIESSLENFKKYLVMGKVIISGISFYDAYESSEVAKTGIFPPYKSNYTLVGGHAIVIVGYNDATKMIKFRNDWGQSWGDKGYAYISYGDISKIFADSYVINDIL